MMNEMYDEERIGQLLRALPPAPEAWIQAAARLPATRRAIDQIAALAAADAELRREVLADLEGALLRVGLQPDPTLVADLRDRL
ncbi:MAG: hypothetical protein QOG33_1861 [Gaiellales bacterium]|jgi:hypothetical protein|nr:hypothetical protein [Gaiellales bacterium]